ncbi:hypothetical protein HPB48_011838 [Haemaphysalis longicornis]|uniref:Band 7 domain-containing protein n=1 Tax=Haemaphysalis longicornis TaxID=44386 RepID=A0A9J6GY74_HAELO|nr:hypothetical protein HPB48_011838 [Haemaphysalis longicornis]
MKKALIHSRLLHHLPYENPSKTELKINIVSSKAQKAALGVPAYTANQALADKGTTNTIEELITAPKITQLQRLRDSEQGIQILRSLGYEVLTKDSVTVAVDAVVWYRVQDAVLSVANVANAHYSTHLLAQTMLRNILGTRNLHEILAEREQISSDMQASMRAAVCKGVDIGGGRGGGYLVNARLKSALDLGTDPWGIKVERVEIKDVRLPVQLQRAMAAEAEAAREARAKLIAAEGEQKASRALKEAADTMALSPAALQLRISSDTATPSPPRRTPPSSSQCP